MTYLADWVQDMMGVPIIRPAVPVGACHYRCDGCGVEGFGTACWLCDNPGVPVTKIGPAQFNHALTSAELRADR